MPEEQRSQEQPSPEKRRYFRINEKVGLAFEWLDAKDMETDAALQLREDDVQIKKPSRGAWKGVT